MTINNNYNFGLLTDDGTTSNPTSLQNLKSFTLIYDQSSGTWTLDNKLDDFFVEYYPNTQTTNGGVPYDGLVVYNKLGKNFVILVDNMCQQYLTTANFITLGPANSIPVITSPYLSLNPITYPELPTFICGWNGYNIPNKGLNGRYGFYTFYLVV